MGELNEDSDGFWSHYQLRPSNGRLEYDKEMIKRTILEHEAIFRKQVYELHRLYRIQKNMMYELKKGQCRNPQTETSQSNSFSSRFPSESNNQTPLTITDDKKHTLNFLHESSVKSRPVPIGKDVVIKDGELMGLENKGIPKKMFDLELPAELYIDCEDAERLEKKTVAESSSVARVRVNRTRCDRPETEGPSCQNVNTQNGLSTQGTTDLNEPVKEITFGSEACSVSSNCVHLRTLHAENNRGKLFPVRSTTDTSCTCSTSAFHKGAQADEGSSLNHLCADDEETSRDLPFFNKETGKSMSSSMRLVNPSSFKERMLMPSEQIPLNHKSHEFFPLDLYKRDAWFIPKLEISGRSHSQYTAQFANSFSDRFLVNQCSNGVFNKWNSIGDSRSQYRVGTGSSSYSNNFNNSGTDVHLNQNLLNGFLNGFSPRKINESKGEGPEKIFNVVNQLDLSSSLQMETTIQKNSEMLEGENSRKIFGVSIDPEKVQQSQTVTAKCEETESSSTSFRNRNIDLNFDINSEVISAESETLPPAPTVASDTDLEAEPVADEALIVREAAESIILISSRNVNSVDENPLHASSLICFKSLDWFAEFVSSTNDENTKQRHVPDEFEQMTLELKERTPNEFWSGHPLKKVDNDENDQNDEKSNIASLLFTKPRGKKRRRKRDFQKDILPGLASLSRQEVSNDLQTIGGLMKASGEPWQARGTRRGASSRGLRSLAIYAGKIKRASPPLPPPPTLTLPIDDNCGDAGAAAASNNNNNHINNIKNNNNNYNYKKGSSGGSSMIGWGRTTRRCRRLRLVGNAAAPQT